MGGKIKMICPKCGEEIGIHLRLYQCRNGFVNEENFEISYSNDLFGDPIVYCPKCDYVFTDYDCLQLIDKNILCLIYNFEYKDDATEDEKENFKENFGSCYNEAYTNWSKVYSLGIDLGEYLWKIISV